MFAPLAAGNGAAVFASGAGRSQPVPIVPVPTDAPKCTWRHAKHGAPVAMWPYHDRQGRLAAYAARVEYDDVDGTRAKDVLPVTYCCIDQRGAHRYGWRARAIPAPRPLYRLPELLANPASPVVVTEGEKKADAAPGLFPGYLATTSMGGARSARLSDWAPIAGRKVIIWPDHDEPGRRYAHDVAALATEAGAALVAIVAVPTDWPEGWDIADPLPEGASPDMLAVLLRTAEPWMPPAQNQPGGVDSAVEIARLAALPPLQYDREREAAAKRLGCRASTLDGLVARQRGEPAGAPGQGRPLELYEPDPWPSLVDGAALLEETVAAIRQYVILTERQAEATALWVIFTHAFDAFDFSPRLVISSAEKRSGKTRLVEVLNRIVRKPLFVSGITGAALLRVIDQHAPCMLLDEIDTMMNGDAVLREALRGLINSGFDLAGARHIKNVPTRDGGYEPLAFSMWCPMLLAGIGKLPGTVADRSIPIEMERKRSDEKVKPLRAGDGDELRNMGRKVARWVTDNLAALRGARPEPPVQIHDRAADAWSPLFAIADLAGGTWPKRARLAAIELSTDGEDAMSSGVLLLADLRELFANQPSGVLFTREILKALHADETRPWPEWKNGRPITDRQLAALLKPYKVKPKTVRRGIETDKGYRLDWFDALFASYLPPRSVTASQSSIPAAFDADLSVTMPVPATPNVTDRRTEKSSVSALCDGVTLPGTGPGDAEFGERAAILEYDGGSPRSEAERLARAEIGNPQRRHETFPRGELAGVTEE
jgi:hypothetical protein